MTRVDRLLYQTLIAKKPDSEAGISDLIIFTVFIASLQNRIDHYHTTIRYTCMVVSLLTECTNGNSILNGSLKGHRLSEHMVILYYITNFHTLYRYPFSLPLRSFMVRHHVAGDAHT